MKIVYTILILFLFLGCENSNDKVTTKVIKEGTISNMTYVGRYANILQITFTDGAIRKIPGYIKTNEDEIKIGQTGILTVRCSYFEGINHTQSFNDGKYFCDRCQFFWDTKNIKILENKTPN